MAKLSAVTKTAKQLIASEHSQEIKIKAFAVYVKKTFASIIEDVEDYLSLADDYLKTNNNTAVTFGKILLTQACNLHENQVRRVYSGAHFETFIPHTLFDNEQAGGQIRYLHNVASTLQDIRIVQLLLPVLDPLSYDLGIPASLPTTDTQLALVQMWREFPSLLPKRKSLLSDTFVRWIAMCSCTSQKKATAFVSEFLRVMKREWDNTPSVVLETLELIFVLLAGGPILNGHITTAEKGKKPPPSAVSPSPSLSLLVEGFPRKYISQVPAHIARMTAVLPATHLSLAIDRLFQWPLNDCISAWVLALLEGLCIARSLSLVLYLSLSHVNIKGHWRYWG